MCRLAVGGGAGGYYRCFQMDGWLRADWNAVMDGEGLEML